MDEKKSENAVCEGFALWKYSFENHPLQNERRKYREVYYCLMKKIVMELAGEHPAHSKIFHRLQDSLNISKIESVSMPVEELYRMFSGGIFWHGGLRFGWTDYRGLLLLEAGYLSWALTGKVNMQIIDDYSKLLKIEARDSSLLQRYIPNIFLDEEKIICAISDELSSYMKKSLCYMKRCLCSKYRHDKMPRYHVAVCATMSSGKSTLLNALLGTDYIPFGNLACTAKILSIDNDSEQNILLGCRKVKDGSSEYAEVTSDLLKKWNMESEVSHICLAGKILGIKSSNRMLCLYDTPGINSSQNLSHEKVTKQFLANHPMNLVLYVCNAEQVCTTDEADFLSWLKENLVEKRGIEIIFIVNKMDSLDNEKEDPKVFLEHIRENLSSRGFKNPIMLPISASAACLFRMVLDGKKLTRRNKLDFNMQYQYFKEMGNDFKKLSNSYCSVVANGEYKIDGTIFVDDNEFVKQDLLEATERTGIFALEKILEQKLEGEIE